jgi:hypothetical protein
MKSSKRTTNNNTSSPTKTLRSVNTSVLSLDGKLVSNILERIHRDIEGNRDTYLALRKDYDRI